MDIFSESMPPRQINARETVDHFLFRYQKWTAYRTEILQYTHTHRSNVSFFLGGKSPSDDQK
ncbi:hypothetical protein N7527_006480 [Penicillium freii]|nr:hypothetical protein N7527_006480 [Penicillium freii]